MSILHWRRLHWSTSPTFFALFLYGQARSDEAEYKQGNRNLSLCYVIELCFLLRCRRPDTTCSYRYEIGTGNFIGNHVRRFPPEPPDHFPNPNLLCKQAELLSMACSQLTLSQSGSSHRLVAKSKPCHACGA
jgi:hypothetical protein